MSKRMYEAHITSVSVYQVHADSEDAAIQIVAAMHQDRNFKQRVCIDIEPIEIYSIGQTDEEEYD